MPQPCRRGFMNPSTTGTLLSATAKWITDMSLEQSLSADIVTAMKAKDQTKLTALRMLKTALTNKSIEKGRALETTEELQVVSMLVKQRRDSIEQFTKGGRKDLADKEQAEIL